MSAADSLRASLAAHWTAQQAYQAAAACSGTYWGYAKLAARWQAEAADEVEHARRLLDRLAFLDEDAAFEHDPADPPTDDLVALFRYLLRLEESAATIERNGIRAARAASDEGTADVFRLNLLGSEESILALEQSLRQIEGMGIENFLGSML